MIVRCFFGGIYMQTLYDVQQYLRMYRTIIYTGDPLFDLYLMKNDLDALHIEGILPTERYLSYTHVIKERYKKLESET